MKTRGLGVSFQRGRQSLCHEHSSPCIELSKNNLINDKKGNIKRGAEKSHFLCFHHFRVTNAVAQGLVSIHLHASHGFLPTSIILLSSLQLRPGKLMEKELFISVHSDRGVGLWLTGSLALDLPPACVSRWQEHVVEEAGWGLNVKCPSWAPVHVPHRQTVDSDALGEGCGIFRRWSVTRGHWKVALRFYSQAPCPSHFLLPEVSLLLLLHDEMHPLELTWLSFHCFFTSWRTGDREGQKKSKAPSMTYFQVGLFNLGSPNLEKQVS